MDYGTDTSREALLFNESYYKDLKEIVSAAGAICDRLYYIPGNVSGCSSKLLPLIKTAILQFYCSKFLHAFKLSSSPPPSLSLSSMILLSHIKKMICLLLLLLMTAAPIVLLYLVIFISEL